MHIIKIGLKYSYLINSCIALAHVKSKILELTKLN